jgi:hypothetical protein
LATVSQSTVTEVLPGVALTFCGAASSADEDVVLDTAELERAELEITELDGTELESTEDAIDEPGSDELDTAALDGVIEELDDCESSSSDPPPQATRVINTQGSSSCLNMVTPSIGLPWVRRRLLGKS